MRLFYILVLSLFSIPAFAGKILTVKSLECTSGEVHIEKSIPLESKLTLEELSLIVKQAGGKILSDDRHTVAYIKVSGDNDGVCANNGIGTVLVIKLQSFK